MVAGPYGLSRAGLPLDRTVGRLVCAMHLQFQECAGPGVCAVVDAQALAHGGAFRYGFA